MRRVRAIAMAAAAAASAVWFGATASRAEAGHTYVRKTVRVPYTYYAYETQTRYRTVTQPVREVEYRTERQAYTVCETEYQLVGSWLIDSNGRSHWSVGLQPVRVEKIRHRTVRVPVTVTRYRTIQVPYTVRVHVQKTGYRTETRLVRVEVPDRRPVPNIRRPNPGGAHGRPSRNDDRGREPSRDNGRRHIARR